VERLTALKAGYRAAILPVSQNKTLLAQTGGVHVDGLSEANPNVWAKNVMAVCEPHCPSASARLGLAGTCTDGGDAVETGGLIGARHEKFIFVILLAIGICAFGQAKFKMAKTPAD